MDKQQQFPTLLQSLNNLPLHNLLSIVQYLDQETKMLIQQNSTKSQNNGQIFQNLVRLFLFTSKYLNSTDRSVYFNFYNQPAFLEYEKDLIGNICVRNPNKYFKIQSSLQKILQQIRLELQCLDNKQSLIQIIETNIKDPLIPLPKMRKQGLAMYCNSSLQFCLIDLIFQNGQQQDNYIQDCILELQQFLECIQNNMQQIISQKIKHKIKGKSLITIIKQIYYNPQLLNIQNYQQYIIKQLTTYNLFIYIHVIISGIAQMYHQYIIDQQKQFQRFIQYLLRYGIFRSIILCMEQSNISKILYTAVQKLIQKVDILTLTLTQQKINIKLQQQIIIQANIQLQNKKSGQQLLQIQQLNLINNISRLSSQIKTQRSQKSIQLYKNINIQMRSRLYLACGKIWANQNRRVKQLNQENSSPMKYNNFVSQDTINNKSFMKILNRLLHFSIQSKLQKEIQESGSHCVNINAKKQIMHVVRDQDIWNIFGPDAQHHEILSPTNSLNSISMSSASVSPGPSSPTNMPQNFSEIMKNADNICAYENFARAVQNKFKVQQYRYQKGKQSLENDASSISPQKQKQMPQLSLQNLTKIPSLKQNRLFSKVSMMSKFTKISQKISVSSVQDLFESDISVQQQILMQYHSHLMDLSVNQYNVHWCGHSEQPLMFDYYQQFQDLLVKFNQGFMYYTLKTVEQVANKIINQQRGFQLQSSDHTFYNISLKLLKRLLEWQLQYLDIGFVSKRTIKKLGKIANDLLLRACKKYKVQIQEKDMINFDNTEVDKMIEHYNETMWKIQRNPPVQKLKVYQQRKSPRNIIQVARHPQNQNKQKNNGGKKPQRKRRNSQQVLVVHNME